MTDSPDPQSVATVLMVRPAHFAFNPQTAASNAFQSASLSRMAEGSVQDLALREFEGLAAGLRRAGVSVVIADDTTVPIKPDAIFPNNWVSFHRDGTVVLYPMMAPNRRLERREEVVRQVALEGGFHTSRTVDLSHREIEGKFLEGTGSLVLDRRHRVAYAGLSPRTDLDVLGEFAQLLDYELVTFDAVDDAGRAIYHTNVLMAVGTAFAVLCTEVIAPEHRSAVTERLRASGHDVLEISLAQMQQFAGNLLELAPVAGRVIAVSNTAWQSLEAAQRRQLERHGGVVIASIPVIERLGGGSVRCMLAEVHLPKLARASMS